MAFHINKKTVMKGCLGMLFLLWFTVVYVFSSQTGRESSKVSEQVTRELLKMKDTLSIVLENDFKELTIKRNSSKSNYQ